MKILQINPASHSVLTDNYKSDIFTSWYARVAYQINKFYPNLKVECWTLEKKYKKEKSVRNKGIKFRIFPVNFSIRHGMEISIPIITALRKEIKKKDKIVLHFHEYHSWVVYFFLLLLKKRSNIKIIAQHHGGRSPFDNLKKYKRLMLFFPVIFLMQLCEMFLLRKVDVFYALSIKERDYLKKIAPKSEIKFQTMGISDEYFVKMNKETSRNELGLKQNEKYALFLGRIKTTKGIKELLNAVKGMDLNLLLIGEGPDYNKYVNYVKKEKIDNAAFLGYVYGEKKLLYLSACDFLVLPSYTEGAPVVLMEAMAAGLSPIATNVGGIPLMVQNGKNGLIINPRSSQEIVGAIKKVLKNPFEDIKKYAEPYRWKKIIQETIKDY
ncbi:MAG: glycosyltransferase family 4 protein [Nanoarchaeota archaeon]|nr:glycosyltransferase family 4 protein [Nanoarchaeota archaeon]